MKGLLVWLCVYYFRTSVQFGVVTKLPGNLKPQNVLTKKLGVDLLSIDLVGNSQIIIIMIINDYFSP